MFLRLALLGLLSFGFAVSPALGDLDLAAAAAKKKISHKRSDFTAEQREKMMEEARKICRKRYGAGALVYKMDHYKWKVWCLEG